MSYTTLSSFLLFPLFFGMQVQSSEVSFHAVTNSSLFPHFLTGILRAMSCPYGVHSNFAFPTAPFLHGPTADTIAVISLGFRFQIVEALDHPVP